MYKTFVNKNDDGSETETTLISGPGFRIKIRETSWNEPSEEDSFEDIWDRVQIKKVDKNKAKCDSEKINLNELRQELYDKAVDKGALDNLKDISKEYDKEELLELSEALPSLIADPEFVSKVMNFVLEEYRKTKEE